MRALLAVEAAEPASTGIMVLFALAMVATYVGVAYERFHKTVATLLGAGLIIVLALVFDVFEYTDIYEILAEDLNIFGVIVGTGILVDVTGKSGLFHFLSMLVVRATGGRAGALWSATCVLTFLLVSVLTIVPAMLIMSSLVLVMCRSLGYPPKAFLISAAICANSGALVTLASGLPNIIIGTAADIPYVQFLIVSAPYAVISLVVAMALLRVTFRGDLPWRQSPDEVTALKGRMDEFDPWALVEDRRVLARSAVILVVTIIGFGLAQPVGVGVDFVAMAGGTAALLFAGRGVEDTINKVNWTVILFFTGLFLIIGAVRATGALDRLAEGVVALSGDSVTLLVVLLGAFAGVASGIVDNIPVAATLIPIVQNITSQGVEAEPLWWTLVIGTNVGGNATPIGSISCVIALYALKQEFGVVVGWGEFLRAGGLVMVVQVVVGIGYVLALHALDALPAL